MDIINNVRHRTALLPSSFLTCIFLMIGFVSCSQIVQAHDPGLSLIEIKVENEQINIHATFARKDVEQLVLLDTDNNGAVSYNEFVLAKAELETFIQEAFQFQDGSVALVPVVSDIQLDQSDAVHFRLVLHNKLESQLIFRSGLLDSFALGHRQFVKILKHDEMVGTGLLSASDRDLRIELPKTNFMTICFDFIVEGIWHIWIGIDHILFVITLLLPSVMAFKSQGWQPEPNFKQVLILIIRVISAFTVAHSLTLALTVLNVIVLPVRIVESVIAASVIAAGCNNVFGWIIGRIWVMAFGFGLIHGMGFASVLNELSISSDTKLPALVGFNLGVEIGQLAIVGIVLPVLFVLRKQQFYFPLLVRNGSWVVVLIATVWLVERAISIDIFQLLTSSVIAS